MGKNELQKAGLKVTVPRTRILALLERDRSRHLDAEAIHRELCDEGDEIGLATVYRVLGQFEAAGLVQRHNFEGGQSVFELDEGGHHDHIVCTRCGRVDEFVDEDIEALQNKVARNAGYQITGHALHLYGICADCRD